MRLRQQLSRWLLVDHWKVENLAQQQNHSFRMIFLGTGFIWQNIVLACKVARKAVHDTIKNIIVVSWILKGIFIKQSGTQLNVPNWFHYVRPIFVSDN